MLSDRDTSAAGPMFWPEMANRDPCATPAFGMPGSATLKALKALSAMIGGMTGGLNRTVAPRSG